MNTHFLIQNENAAQIIQYVLLSSIENRSMQMPMSTIVYDVWFKKMGQVWKIAKYRIKTDVDMMVSKTES